MPTRGPARKTAAPQAPAGSLYRAHLLLMTLARGSRNGTSLADLVQRTGLPRPTIHRVLDMLSSLGWVVRDPQTARFNLGHDLAALGHVAIARHPLEQIAATELGELADRLNQVVYINVRSGLDMVCVGRYESESQISVGKGNPGLRGPFGMSQGCLAMMSRMPEDEVRRIVEINMPRYHRIEGFDERGFRRALAEAMRTGYATYDDIILDRTTSALGVPVCHPDGHPVAGIGTTYITGWLTEKQRQACLRHMREAADRIARRLFAMDHTPA